MTSINVPEVKTEPGTEQNALRLARPLPALPSLGKEMPAAGGESVPVSVKKAKAVKVEVVQTSSVLQEILGDVYFVKAEPAKTPMEQAELQVSAYKKEAPVPLTTSPLTWWKDQEYTYPLLAKVARNLLCIPATSVPSERVFSTAGDIVTQQRSSIKRKHVDMLIFLKKNLPKKPRQ